MCAELRCDLNTELFGTEYQVIARPINVLLTISACFVNDVKLILMSILLLLSVLVMLCFYCIIFTLHPPLHYHLNYSRNPKIYLLVYKLKIPLIALKHRILLTFQLDTARTVKKIGVSGLFCNYIVQKYPFQSAQGFQFLSKSNCHILLCHINYFDCGLCQL